LDVKPFKRKTTKKWKIEKYCQNPLVYPLKTTCSDVCWEGEFTVPRWKNNQETHFSRALAEQMCSSQYCFKESTFLSRELH